MSARHELLSFGGLISYGIVVLLLALYALLWQISLRKIPLTTAFMCKGFTLVLALALSSSVFQETITINNIIGSAMVIIGILLLFIPEKA